MLETEGGSFLHKALEWAWASSLKAGVEDHKTLRFHTRSLFRPETWGWHEAYTFEPFFPWDSCFLRNGVDLYLKKVFISGCSGTGGEVGRNFC